MQQGPRYALLFAPMWGIPPVELYTYRPRHPQFFHHPPVYRYGGPCFARLPGDVPEPVSAPFDTPRPKLYCAMGVSSSPRVLAEVVEIANNLEIQSVIATTTILPELSGNCSGRVLLTVHVPAHLFNPLAGTAMPQPGAPG